MQLWLDVYDTSGNRVGAGPLTALTSFKITQKLSAAGAWSATIPASDLRAMTLLQPKRRILAYKWDAVEGTEFLGGGVVEDLRVRIDDGAPMLEVSGGDLLSELAQAVVGYTESSDGETTIRAAMPAGWTIVETDALPVWSARYAYESVLAAWVRAAEQVGFSFRLAPSGATIRRLEFFATVVASGVRATLHAQSPAVERNAMLCMIRTLGEERTSWDIANRAYVFGAGDWAAQLTLAYATLWPDGDPTSGGYTDPDGNTWTVTLANSQIDCTSSQATYGTLPVRVDAKDISPLSNSTADLQAAANALLAAALQAMRWRVAPQYAYTLDVGALRQQLLPGQSIWVEARQMVDGERPVDIDRALTILAIDSAWNADAVRTDKLTVATSTTLPRDDVSVLIGAIQAGHVSMTYPQLSASIDTLVYSEPIDDDAGADLRFWLGEETATVNQVLLRYRVDPLRSTAKAVGGTVTGTVDMPDHVHSFTLPNHQHTVTLDAHHHDIPDHQHDLTIIGNGTGALTYNIGFGAGGTAGGVRHNIDANDWVWVTDSESGGTTSEQGGSAPETSSDGGGSAITNSGDGGAADVSIDLSSALTLTYGIFEESGANTYAYSDLEWEVNGVAVTESPTSLGSGWYALDLTSYVVDAGGLRPAQAANVVSVAVKAASYDEKTCQVNAQIERRTIIQAIAYV